MHTQQMKFWGTSEKIISAARGAAKREKNQKRTRRMANL